MKIKIRPKKNSDGTYTASILYLGDRYEVTAPSLFEARYGLALMLRERMKEDIDELSFLVPDCD